MKQVNVALPDEIRGYLEEIAAKNGRKLSEEVRARLDQSVVDDRFDAVTKELAKDIMWLAHMVTEGSKWALPDGATWATDERLFQALKVSVDAWMTDLAGRLNLQRLSEGAQLDPVTLGKSNARGYAEIKPMLIKHRPGGDNLPPTSDNTEETQ
jgi:predicted phage gp36 major capsid-like protein